MEGVGATGADIGLLADLTVGDIASHAGIIEKGEACSAGSADIGTIAEGAVADSA